MKFARGLSGEPAKIVHKHFGMVGVALANNERRNQLCVRIQRNKRPDIAISTGAAGVLLLRADESPNFVNFNLLAGQAAHFLVHDFLAGFADAQRQTANRVAVNAGDAFNGADAAPSQSMEITVTFFSVLRLFAISLL